MKNNMYCLVGSSRQGYKRTYIVEIIYEDNNLLIGIPIDNIHSRIRVDIDKSKVELLRSNNSGKIREENLVSIKRDISYTED